MASSTFSNLFFFLFLVFVLFNSTNSQSKLDQLKETEMSLYFQDYSGGPNATVIGITGQPSGPLNFTKFGAAFATDDPITEGIDPNSAEVGRGRGLYVTSALDGSHTHVMVSIVFTNQKYKGSTLEIQGSSPQFERVREVAVVGGTGIFRFARGFANFETIRYDPSSFYAAIRYCIIEYVQINQ